MAAATFITRDNYTTLLKRSTVGRAGTPDGNVFIDTANDLIELITVEELATVDLGSGAEANPLTNATKIQALALYFFLLQEVEADATLQQFRTYMDAVPNRMGKLVGATAFLNGIKLSDGGSLSNDRLKIGGSGFTEFAVTGGGNTLEDRIYHGTKSLGNIDSESQPFYQIVASLSESDRQAAAPVNFSKTGDVDEVIQTFGTTANGDTGAGTADNKAAVLILGVRTFGSAVGEFTSVDAGVAELGAYQQGYGLSEAVVSDLTGISSTDVFGGSQIAPWTGAGLTRLASPQVESGFNEANGNFTDIITNTGGMSLTQARAYMDMLMQQDTDQNANTGVTGSFIPKRAAPLYTINSAGKLVTRQGLFIDSIPAGDQQSVIFTDDAGGAKTYPFNVGINIKLSSTWFNDAAPWFRLMFDDGAGALDFDTATAVTVEDASAVAVSGNAGDGRIVAVSDYYELRISFAYDTNTQAGLSAAIDKTLIMRVGGTTTSKERTVTIPVTRIATISVDASTEAETN